MTTTAAKTALQASLAAVKKSWNEGIAAPINAEYVPLLTAPQTPETLAAIAMLRPTVDSFNLVGAPLRALIAAIDAIVPVDPLPAKPVITGFVAAPANIQPGQSTVLSATVSGATSLTLDGKALLPVPKAGIPYSLSITVTPTAPMPQQTYRLVATGPGGSATADCFVTIKPPVVVPPVKAVTTTIIAASKNPITVNQPVVITATVIGKNPSGEVTFINDGGSYPAIMLAANGVASSPATAYINAHATVWTASYSGDANNLPSDSAPLTITVNPVPVGTPVPATSVTITAVSDLGIATGTAIPASSTFPLWIDDDYANHIMVTAVGGQWTQRLVVPAGAHTVFVQGSSYRFTRSTAPAPVTGPVVQGLAAKYPGDVGIGADPDVLFVVDFNA